MNEAETFVQSQDISKQPCSVFRTEPCLLCTPLLCGYCFSFSLRDSSERDK